MSSGEDNEDPKKGGCQCGGSCTCHGPSASRVAARVRMAYTVYPAAQPDPYFFLRNPALVRQVKREALAAGHRVFGVRQGKGSTSNYIEVVMVVDRDLDEMKALANFLVERFPGVPFIGDVHPTIDVHDVTIRSRQGPNKQPGQRPN